MKKQQVEAVVRETCPELMGLTFGCEVKVNGVFYVLDSNWAIETRTGNNLNEYKVITDQFNNWTEIEDFEIIGHPIQVSNVLRAIDSPKFFIDTNGWIGEMVSINPMKCTRRIKYNLSLPFSEQSEEVYDFLHELLVTKD